MIRRAISYAKLGWDFSLRRSPGPFILGLAVTDRCDGSCRHCRVGRPDGEHMPFAVIRRYLRDFYRRGARFCYLEGGEPTLWRDAHRRVDDIIAEARRTGYLRVHIYTNGRRPLEASDDHSWVAVDGLPETHKELRGYSVEPVLAHIRQRPDKRISIVHTINAVNLPELERALPWIAEQAPDQRIIAYFHTPYYGLDELHLPPARRREAVEVLLRLKDRGLPLHNSVPGLKALASGDYPRPGSLWWVVDGQGAHRCCRAVDVPGVCQHCGYAACAELILAQQNPWLAARQALFLS